MKIAIYGSCVSRDTCEYIPNSKVVAYTARQSAVSLLNPIGPGPVNLSNLNSPFQKRMVLSDLAGRGIQDISEHSSELDLILIDIVDERRGYWLTKDGKTFTNSLEAENSGLVESQESQGARLVAFGTDEHFQLWLEGFSKLTEDLRHVGLLNKTVFIDVAWAKWIERSGLPGRERQFKIGRTIRRIQRRTKIGWRAFTKGLRATEAIERMRNLQATQAEEFFDRAERANKLSQRYREEARRLLPVSITRESHEVKIGQDHKWGPQPFHYRRSDYESIARELINLRPDAV